MSHNLVTENKQKLSCSKIGTPTTFHGDKSSEIAISTSDLQMMQESLQYLHLNPIPVLQLGREAVCWVTSLRVLQDSTF